MSGRRNCGAIDGLGHTCERLPHPVDEIHRATLPYGSGMEWYGDSDRHLGGPTLAERQQAAAAAIDVLTGENPEGDHRKVEEILLDLAGPSVREAYERLAGLHGDATGRADWWAWS